MYYTSWNASAANRSLGVIPEYCHQVVIPSGNDVSILAGEIGKGFTLDVVTGAKLETMPGGLLDIVAQ